MSKSKSKPGSANSRADKGTVAPASNRDLSVSAKVIIESDNQQYKGLYIRLISEWVDCCSNSKVIAQLRLRAVLQLVLRLIPSA